jgi:hypothetical protein
MNQDTAQTHTHGKEELMPPASKVDTLLDSCFGKTLRVYTSDGRIFVGTFKCTDNVSASLEIPSILL